MKNKIFLESPVPFQSFIWLAAYLDGSFLPEYSFDNQQKNSFYDINKSNLIRFGLVGYNMNLYYEVYGGEFKLAGRMFEVIYRDKKEDKEYYLTGHALSPYTDIIQFKEGYTDFDPLSSAPSSTGISKYNFGYKKELVLDGIKFNYKAICVVPYGGNVYLNLHLVSDRDFEHGSIIIRKNGIEVFELDAPMMANEKYELNWVVT